MISKKKVELPIIDRLALLSTLNVFQPMSLSEIESGLRRILKGHNSKDVLDYLVSRRLVLEVSEDQYVVSPRGLKAFGPLLRKTRDLRRLLYLTNLSKGKE